MRGMIAGVAAGGLVSALGLAAVSMTAPRVDAAAIRAAVAARQAAANADGPAQAIALPESSEFARSRQEARPAAAPLAPVGDGKAAPAPPQAGATPAQAGQPGTEPAPRPDPGAAPAAPPAPQTARAALEAAPEPSPAMPVPPPGEAVAPTLSRVEGEAGPGAEITLLPDGALLPPNPDLPRGFAPGGGAGFADAAGVKVNRMPQVGASAPAAEEGEALAALEPVAPTAGPGFKRPPLAEAPGTEAALAQTPRPEVKRPGLQTAPVAENTPPGGAVNPAALAAGLAPNAALARFAAPFAAPEAGKPLFSVVLLDVGTGQGGLDRATIAALGPTITVALDPMQPDAAEAAAFYRAAGLEVAMLAGPLPAGATGQDVEVAFAEWHRALPEAVALIEPPKPSLQGSTQLVGQAIKALSAEGMAYVPQAQGIAGGIRAAQGAGLPHATVWRVLDARRDKAAVMSRALSRAAFEASQAGSVVVMLSAWPESVAGLGDWRAKGGAAVAQAPLSALALKAVTP